MNAAKDVGLLASVVARNPMSVTTTVSIASVSKTVLAPVSLRTLRWPTEIDRKMRSATALPSDAMAVRSKNQMNASVAMLVSSSPVWNERRVAPKNGGKIRSRAR